MVLHYSFSLSNVVFQMHLSPFSRNIPLFFSCITDFISDNYLFFYYFYICQNIVAAEMHPNTHRCHSVCCSAEIQALYAYCQS